MNKSSTIELPVAIQCEGCLREFYDWQPHVVTDDDCWLYEECADVE